MQHKTFNGLIQKVLPPIKFRITACLLSIDVIIAETPAKLDEVRFLLYCLN
jgi:hypothetical protein